MVKYKQAIKLPFKDKKILLIGIIISIISGTLASIQTYIPVTAATFVIIIIGVLIGFILSGFFLNVAKSAMQNKKKLPEWKNWGELFVKGVMAFIISLIYMIPIMIIFMIALLSIISTDVLIALFSQNFEKVLTDNIGSLLVLLLVFLVVMIIAMYFITAATLNYVRTWKLKSAFAFKEIAKKAFTASYFAAWIIGLVYLMVLSMVFSIVFFFAPTIGSGIASFIGSITYYTILGEAFSKKK